jgi:hypothetical protein
MDTRLSVWGLSGLMQQQNLQPCNSSFSHHIAIAIRISGVWVTSCWQASCQIYNIIRAPTDTDTADNMTNARTSPPLPLDMVEDAP